MLMDVARGLNYLHNFKPPIIHRSAQRSGAAVGIGFGALLLHTRRYLYGCVCVCLAVRE